MANELPLVTVVITAYNRPDYLRASVTSALAQEGVDLDIVVVDDCSPTDLQAVLTEFSGPIRYRRMEKNGGANRARNEGVRLARGRYVAFLDDDDIWLPNKLAQQLPHLTGASSACLCGFRLLEKELTFVQPTETVTAEMLKWGNPYCGMSGLICERQWLLDNPFDEALDNGQDWDIFVRLALQAPLHYVAQPLFLYRRGSHESITTKVRKLRPADMRRRLAVSYKHREWLGERMFRRRIAHCILGYLGTRDQPWRLVLMALREGGPRATATVLGEKLKRFMQRGGRVSTH
ncbi:MAG TPA: glycosyltransferase family 2 protein [Dongiaceae bacterium]|jgi:glycosyltransferase involved in cell wall biosynthesis|nr:glycosyltransferase family 2 protein [Dongiaceae bacterium]